MRQARLHLLLPSPYVRASRYLTAPCLGSASEEQGWIAVVNNLEASQVLALPSPTGLTPHILRFLSHPRPAMTASRFGSEAFHDQRTFSFTPGRSCFPRDVTLPHLTTRLAAWGCCPSFSPSGHPSLCAISSAFRRSSIMQFHLSRGLLARYASSGRVSPGESPPERKDDSTVSPP
jgi:hypothetical protein